MARLCPTCRSKLTVYAVVGPGDDPVFECPNGCDVRFGVCVVRWFDVVDHVCTSHHRPGVHRCGCGAVLLKGEEP